jgi:hypothetical protein
VIIDNQTPYLIHLAPSRDERMPTRKAIASFAHLSPTPPHPTSALPSIKGGRAMSRGARGGQQPGRRRKQHPILVCPQLAWQVWMKRAGCLRYVPQLLQCSGIGDDEKFTSRIRYADANL